MPKIVELLGPSGVGKSALYYSLQKRWKENDSWAIYHDLSYKRKKRSPVSWVLKIKSFFYKISETDYHWNEGKISDNKKKFAEKHPEFISVFLDLINENAKKGYHGEDKRFNSIYYMLRSIERLNTAIGLKNDERICLMDEALLSRIMHLNSPGFNKSDLYSYLSVMPLPNGVIYLKTTPEKIVERIQNRSRESTVHSGLKENEILKYTSDTQKLMEYSLEFLKERGVKILELDAQKSLTDLTSETIEYLNHLYSS